MTKALTINSTPKASSNSTRFGYVSAPWLAAAAALSEVVSASL